MSMAGLVTSNVPSGCAAFPLMFHSTYVVDVRLLTDSPCVIRSTWSPRATTVATALPFSSRGAMVARPGLARLRGGGSGRPPRHEQAVHDLVLLGDRRLQLLPVGREDDVPQPQAEDRRDGGWDESERGRPPPARGLRFTCPARREDGRRSAG